MSNRCKEVGISPLSFQKAETGKRNDYNRLLIAHGKLFIVE